MVDELTSSSTLLLQVSLFVAFSTISFSFNRWIFGISSKNTKLFARCGHICIPLSIIFCFYKNVQRPIFPVFIYMSKKLSYFFDFVSIFKLFWSGCEVKSQKTRCLTSLLEDISYFHHFIGDKPLGFWCYKRVNLDLVNYFIFICFNWSTVFLS